MNIDRNDFVEAKKHLKLSPGEMLSTIRHLQEMPQSELSKLTGLPQPYISAIENGRESMGRETALKFAYALKVHPGVLLFSDFDMKNVA